MVGLKNAGKGETFNKILCDGKCPYTYILNNHPLEPIVRCEQMDIFKKQEHLYICYADENDEYREVCEVFDAYIDDLTGDYSNYYMPYHFPKKFFVEIWIYFNCKDEGKKYMQEFDPNTDKLVEITNMLL